MSDRYQLVSANPERDVLLSGRESTSRADGLHVDGCPKLATRRWDEVAIRDDEVFDLFRLETLSPLVAELKEAGITTALAEVKEHGMDRLQGTKFLELIGKDRIFLSTHLAMEALKHAGP